MSPSEPKRRSRQTAGVGSPLHSGLRRGRLPSPPHGTKPNRCRNASFFDRGRRAGQDMLSLRGRAVPGPSREARDPCGTRSCLPILPSARPRCSGSPTEVPRQARATSMRRGSGFARKSLSPEDFLHRGCEAASCVGSQPFDTCAIVRWIIRRRAHFHFRPHRRNYVAVIPLTAANRRGGNHGTAAETSGMRIGRAAESGTCPDPHLAFGIRLARLMANVNLVSAWLERISLRPNRGMRSRAARPFRRGGALI